MKVLLVEVNEITRDLIDPLKKGKRIGQLRSLDRLVDILGATGRVLEEVFAEQAARQLAHAL